MQGASIVSVPAGDYFFGNASLVIYHASNFTVRAEAGPGTVQLWFSIGTGVLVNQSSDVVLDGLSVDYDPPAHYQGTVVRVTDDSNNSVIQALVKNWARQTQCYIITSTRREPPIGSCFEYCPYHWSWLASSIPTRISVHCHTQ